MGRAIRYSLRASQELLELLEYVTKNFGQQKAKVIFQQLEKGLDIISETPEIYPESSRQRGLRKYVFSKQTNVYYRVNNDYIEIISFRPNRKDPESF